MIYFLFYCTLSKTIYNFDDIKDYDLTYIFLEPSDVAEIEVPKGYGTIFDQWLYEEDLYIYVEADSTYGPIESSSTLVGIFFNNTDYIVRLVNDGLDPTNMTITFAYGMQSYFNTLNFGYLHIEKLTFPFVYRSDSAEISILMIIMACLFGAIMFIPCWSVSCCC